MILKQSSIHSWLKPFVNYKKFDIKEIDIHAVLVFKWIIFEKCFVRKKQQQEC